MRKNILAKLIATVVVMGGATLMASVTFAPLASANPTCTGTVSGSTPGTCSIDGELDVNAGPLEFTVTGNSTASPCPATTDVCAVLNSVTLNGFDQWTSGNMDAGADINVVDATGSGAGWNFGIDATQFLYQKSTTTGSTTSCAAPGLAAEAGGTYACLPVTTYYTDDNTSTPVTTQSNPSGAAPSFSCASGSTCTTPTNSDSGYPIDVASGSQSSATPVSVFNAAANTGMGSILVSGDYLWQEVPANSYAGTYSSTVTLALASGPSGSL